MKQTRERLTIQPGHAYHLSRVKVREILSLLKDDGWYLISTEGSHRQLKHPTKPGRVTVSGHPRDDIHPKTLKSILTQAGLKKN
jgi:predicted RNA binding protein YcfA (HicA-like mRNA interferase family)